MFGIDRQGLKLVYALTLVTYHASGRDTRISMSVSKKNKSGNVTHKGICQVIKMTFVFVLSGRPRAGHRFDIRHMPLHCAVMGWDGFYNNEIIPV